MRLWLRYSSLIQSKIIRVALPKEAQEIYREAYNRSWAATDTALDEGR
jgi:hypothetical protein